MGVKIRLATLDDVEHICAMAAKFLNQSAYGKLFPPAQDAIEVMVGIVLGQGACAVAVLEREGQADATVGMLAIVVHPHPFNGKLCAEELAWWVDPLHRKRGVGPQLLAWAEVHATRKGATVLKMSAPAGTSVGNYLEQFGYEPLETAFVRVLTPI